MASHGSPEARARQVVYTAIARRGVVALTLVLILAACTPRGSAAPASPPSSSGASASPIPAHLIVFGAASLGKVLERVKATYEAAHPGTTLTISADSSGMLAMQIEQGAHADVFLAADTKHPQKLMDHGLVDGSLTDFARNKLTLITPKGNPGGLKSPFDLARPGVRILAAGDDVPITAYARRLVDNLASHADAPADFAASYEANVVSKEDNVSAVRSKIELGEGDAAIVYASDAAESAKVDTIDIPDAANVSATYAGVVVKGSQNAAAAHAFLDWLTGSEGQTILGDFGFLRPTSE